VKNILILLFSTIILLGCASPGMLPKSAAEIDFSAVGMVKGSGWHDGAVYEATEDEVISAVRAALMVNGMRIKEFSKADRRFMAESPMNLYRWASYIGIYYRPRSAGKFEVHVVALSNKDVNILTDDSEAPLPPKILASIYSSLSRR